jgi:hypothetical protein
VLLDDPLSSSRILDEIHRCAAILGPEKVQDAIGAAVSVALMVAAQINDLTFMKWALHQSLLAGDRVIQAQRLLLFPAAL